MSTQNDPLDNQKVQVAFGVLGALTVIGSAFLLTTGTLFYVSVAAGVLVGLLTPAMLKNYGAAGSGGINPFN